MGLGRVLKSAGKGLGKASWKAAKATEKVVGREVLGYRSKKKETINPTTGTTGRSRPAIDHGLGGSMDDPGGAMGAMSKKTRQRTMKKRNLTAGEL